MNPQLELLGNYLELACKLSLIGIFLTAGIAKLFDPEGSRRAIINFGFPEKFAAFGAVAIPAIELILVVVFLLNPSVAWYGVSGCLILLLFFTILMLVQMARGKTADCHCFGQLYSQTVGLKSIVKNILMMVPAVVLLFRMPVISLTELYEWLNGSVELTGAPMYFIFGVTIIILLFVIVFYLKRSTDEQRILNSRLDDLSLPGSQASAAHQHHEHMTSPDEGLPIGAPVPDFELPDMQGRAVSFEQLLMRGKPMLFFFISPTCAPCKSLLPEIGKWQEEFAGKVEFIFVSTGSAEENGAKLGQLGGQIHLLQKKREVAELFKAKWTPTSVLVNSLGEIAGRPAAGDTAIRDLFELIKEKQPENLDFVANGRGMSPNELKIGTVIPEFELPDVTGKTFSENLLKGKRTLALFWGLDCPHCKRMLPEVKDWESAGSNGTGLVIFSSGDVEENRALGLKAPLLIDEGNKIGTEMGMFGTPSAVLVDEAGKIVSETAVGAEQIWALAGKR